MMAFADIPCQKPNITRVGMRIPEKYRKCRYAKISQLLEAGQFCRYVGSKDGSAMVCVVFAY
jgi:hypothetical protein